MTTITAQTALQGQLAPRAMTRDDIAAYKLPSTTELSPGLSTVAIGQPLHLEAQLDATIPASDIGSLTWSLIKPNNSTATLAESPLTANMPTFEPAAEEAFQVAGRKLLRPDVVGTYVVTVAITTGSHGTATWKMNITAATYVGIKSCAMCHGGAIMPDSATPWSKTLHAGIFKDNINGADGASYSTSCLVCHTVGYNPATSAANGGFDKVAAQLNWTMPAVAQAGNWEKVPVALQNLANIQCENCHGPGSLHASNAGNKSMISVTMDSGTCNQCHSAATHHIKGTEWVKSMHAVTTRDPSGAGREGCVGCHTAGGFVGRVRGDKTVNTDYSAITCQACHEPHGQTAPDGAKHQIRTLQAVSFADGTKITSGGAGMLCMNCHQSRQNAATYATSTAGTARFGPHHGTQGDMLAGVNAVTYGKKIPSSAHFDMVEDTCVTCHMQPVDPADPTFTNAGGHTFKAAWQEGGVNLVAACQNCHGNDVTSFDFPLFDYNNDGVIEGVQTEVQHLMDTLSALLPPVGQPKTALTIDATWTRPQLQAAYNWIYVHDDGSRGIHNTAYAVGLLKASIADLQANSKK